MDSYAAFARVEAEVRPGRPLTTRQHLECGAEAGDEPAVIADISGAALMESFKSRLRDVLADAGEVWAQTTFFVLDPDSWG